MSWLEKIFDVVVAAIGSLIFAVLVCVGALYVLIRMPMRIPLVAWTFDSYFGFFTVFGGLFVVVFVGVMRLYSLAARSAR